MPDNDRPRKDCYNCLGCPHLVAVNVDSSHDAYIECDYDGVTLITDSIKINLKEQYIKFFDTELPSTDSLIKSYKVYVVNTAMYNWVKQNG